jgi:hypothetical protein
VVLSAHVANEPLSMLAGRALFPGCAVAMHTIAKSDPLLL